MPVSMKYAAIVFFLLLGGHHSMAQESDVPCPLSSAIIIDGNAEDWPMTWVQDGEKVFSYNVCADDKNLYVRMRTNDFYAKRKLAAFGLTLWFDPTGKKKKKLGLKFPSGGAEAEDRAVAMRQEGGPGNSAGERADFQKKMDKQLIADLEVLELIGLADEPITSARSGITNGIKVAIDVDEAGGYVYEALIPFKSYRISRASLTELSVGFETGKYVIPKAKVNAKSGATAEGDINTNQLSRMQGYQSLMGNPKLTYPNYVWTKLKLK